MLNVLLEAGAELNGAALAAGIVDKIVLFYAPYVIGAAGVPMAQLRNGKRPPALLRPTLVPCGKDFVLQGYIRDVYGHHRSYRKN
jgi:diaminohydroxyphosphoribosylaminopyrimidine deaminase/5-amino-6-(5-phosphoribosylamino)uracil reductase